MYNAYFQFQESPFGVTPDPHFYYNNAVYREAWATLRYGIQGRKGFVVISGEAGTGKTTLLRKALHELPANIKTAYISNALVNFSELLRLVLKDLGVSSAGNKYDRMEELNRYLLHQFDGGNIVALLLDEAQDLSLECLEELRLLSNLETEKHKLLQIVLVGQPGLEKKLDRPELIQLRQRVALRCRLRPVEPSEIGCYIESRLQTIGRNSVDLFDNECIKKIAFYSKGFPRRINIICDNALLTAYAMSKFKITSDIIDEVAADVYAGTPATTSEEKVSSGPVLERQDVTVKREGLQPMFGTFSRNTRYSIPVVGMLAAILVVGVLGASRYIPKVAFSHSNSTSNIAASAVRERDEIDWAKLTDQVFKVDPPAVPTSHFETIADSNRTVSDASEGTANVPSSKKKEPKPEATAPTGTENKKAEAAPRESRTKASSKGRFFVVEPSLVRAKPTSNAEIIATLQPGTVINIMDRTGGYYRVRSLGTEPIRGYVHEQDAFFDRP